MSKGLPRSLARSKGKNTVVRERISFDVDIDITGVDATVDAGTAVIGDFPEGNILVLGLVSRFAIDGTDASVIADWTGDFAIGTVPQNDVDLGDAGEADLIASTPLTADSGLKTVADARYASASSLCGTIFDNTDGSLEINLNLLIDDNVITDTEVGTFRCYGHMDIAYIVLGDD